MHSTSVHQPGNEDLDVDREDGSGDRANHLRKVLWKYCEASDRQAWLQVLTSFVPFFLGWLAMGYSLHYSYWLTLAIAVPTAGCLMRIFCIQHDCGHRAFFRTKKANDRLGFVCSIFTLTPYHFWLKSHAYHHIHLGNLDFRETGYIKLKTVREYLSLNAWDRFLYRLYRSPLVLFLVGPPLQFAVIHRFTFRVPTAWTQEKKSVHITNFTLAIALAIACLTVGAKTFFLTYAPILILGSSLGVWVFYIQHTFRYAYWHRCDRWSLATASVASSSYYCLPRILQWFTLNNGIHHIHHLDSRIPNYRLEECYRENPILHDVTKISLWESFKCASLALWDENLERMISFRELKSAK